MNGPFVFQDKAATLARLEGQMTTARVLPQWTVPNGAWRRDREQIVAQILDQPWAQRPAAAAARPALIVRSCAAAEDGLAQSLAGHFASVRDVIGAHPLAEAIDTVFASYGAAEAGDQVLVQPMLRRPVASGVATSREVGSGRPYMVISTSRGDDTAIVTGGRSNETEVVYHFRGALEPPAGEAGAVVRMLREVESRTGSTSLDVEFAFVEGEALPVLLQARPLVGVPPLSAPRDRHCRQLALAEQKVAAVLGAHPLARGRRSALGCMTDWNPAEMIGVRPRPLAMSLYRSLVTDKVWARQRLAYGYRDLGGFPLMIDILGSPYIDVRASFESFVPAALDDDAAARVVDHYLDRLLDAPALHDKVEFEIVLSSYAFDIEDRLVTMKRAGVPTADADAIRAALHQLTRTVIDPVRSPRRDDQAALQRLQARHAMIGASTLPPLSAAYWLLEDCRRFGTRPFAGLARVGFIAMELLNSLVTVGAVGEDDRRAFLMSVSTVASRLQRDLQALPRTDFLERYGHLRPGAYDILSPRYDEAPDLYFGALADEEDCPAPAVALQELHAEGRARIVKALRPLLAAHRFELGAEPFLDFIADGVRDREDAKFLFTRNLSDALAKLTAWGAEVGLAPSELAFGDIRVIEQGYGSARDPVDLFCASIRDGRNAFAITEATCLPPVITGAAQVWGFALPAATPNFVTRRAAQGPVVADLEHERLDGAIVLIPSADPGFDWIFAHKLAGLVTAYGGVNSHMAIRAAELDLPAVIGSGERLFAEWSRAPGLKIDCGNRRVDQLLR